MKDRYLRIGKMKQFILSFFIIMALSGVLRADAITFEATVSTTRVTLNEALQLTLTIIGVNDRLDPISLPVLDGFSAKYLGPSTSVSIVNGNYHSERSFIYNLFPNKAGQFQIPPISATIAGQTYRTKPINVEVFATSAQAQASSGISDQIQAPSTESLKDKVMIKVSVDKREVYLNERVPLSIKLLVTDVPIRDIQYPQFDKQGLTVDDFEKPQQGSVVINGVRYDIVEFKTNIYPNRLGDLSLDPVQIQSKVIYKTAQDNSINQDDSFFGSNIFNNFFDSYTTQPLTVTSQPVQLHVSPLPEYHRPRDFSGAIGQFDFQAGISPLQVKAGDPLTLKMHVKGSGNFRNLRMPVFKAPGFKSYEPQIKEAGDEKTLEEVIIPTSAGIKEVPSLNFSYFDTSIKDYKMLTQGPFAIQVMAPSPDQDFKAVGFSDLNKGPLTVPSNQFSFGKIFNEIFKVLRNLLGTYWFRFFLGFIFAAVVSYILWRRFQYRLKNDPAFARRLKAVKEARQALMPAGEFILSGKTKDFYALLSKVLRDYLANKWHRSSSALSIDEIISQLKDVELEQTYITRVKTLLEQADLVCFAGAERSSTNMRADLSQTKDLIACLEKSLK
jgi:BatD DUF11 like domain